MQMADIPTQGAAETEPMHLLVTCGTRRYDAARGFSRADSPRDEVVVSGGVLAEYPFLASFPLGPLSQVSRRC